MIVYPYEYTKTLELRTSKCILKVPFPVASMLGISVLSFDEWKGEVFLQMWPPFSFAEGYRAREIVPGSGKDVASFPGSLNHDTPCIHFLRLAYPWRKLDTI